MPEGWIGFNPDSVQDSIMTLYHEGFELGINVLDKAARFLFTELSKLWCSPKAKEFDDMYRDYIHGLIDRAHTTINNICLAAQRAYNIHSISNGLGYYTDFEYMNIFYNPDYPALLEKAPNGDVGMDRYRVGQIVDQYLIDVTRGLSHLDAIPTTIDLFDPGSEQRKLFLETMIVIHTVFKEEMYHMSKLIKDYTKTEQNNVFRGLQGAVEALNG